MACPIPQGGHNYMLRFECASRCNNGNIMLQNKMNAVCRQTPMLNKKRQTTIDFCRFMFSRLKIIWCVQLSLSYCRKSFSATCIARNVILYKNSTALLQRVPPPRHVELGTVSLPACSRHIRLNVASHCGVTGFIDFNFSVHISRLPDCLEIR